jgi:hypothetical protein
VAGTTIHVLGHYLQNWMVIAIAIALLAAQTKPGLDVGEPEIILSPIQMSASRRAQMVDGWQSAISAFGPAPRRAQPDVALLGRGQDHRHGLRVARFDKLRWATSSGSRGRDGPVVAGGGRVAKYGQLVADGPKPSSCTLPRRCPSDPVNDDCLCEVDDRSTTHLSLHQPWVLLPVMRRLVRVMPKRRLEKVVNKVADDTSNLRLKALPVGLGAFITRPWGGL